ncbi:CD320 isoform 3, partial [Pan troglodytes]
LSGGWMARVGAWRTGALGLALLLLLGLGLGLEAAASPLSTPTSAQAADHLAMRSLVKTLGSARPEFEPQLCYQLFFFFFFLWQ